MPVIAVLAVGFVLFVGLLLAVDRAMKAAKRIRGRREANRRLVAAAAAAEAKVRKRRAAREVSGALTSVIPAIGDLETRRVE
jgi:hypothetical protein